MAQLGIAEEGGLPTGPARVASAPDSWLTRRALEWMLVLALVLILMGIFIRQVRVVQAQAEVAAIKSTLGTLRMSLVLDFVHVNTSPVGRVISAQTANLNSRAVTSAQQNPFLLLAQLPVNYLATASALYAPDSATPLTTAVPVGHWVFDAPCGCVGYWPEHAQVEAPTASVARRGVLWFQLRAQGGPTQLVALERYVWGGEVLN